MKKTFFQICFAFVILAVSMTGCGPSEKDIAEKKQLEAKVVDLENKLQKVMIIENTKTALEEQIKQKVKQDSPASDVVVRCLSVTLQENGKENEWLAEAEILYQLSEGLSIVRSQEITNIQIIYNPENKSVNVDLSNAKFKLTTEEAESSCRANLKYIGLVLSMYAEEHNGNFPDDTKEAEEFFKSDAANNRLCPATEKPYIYIPGLCNGDKAKLPLVYCKYHHKNDDFLQLHIDGSVDYGKVLEIKDLKEQKSVYDSMICRKAQEAMTKWLAVLAWSNNSTCTSITNIKKVSKKKWIAIATASNGKSGKINIIIINSDTDNPTVMVLPDRFSDFK